LLQKILIITNVNSFELGALYPTVYASFVLPISGKHKTPTCVHTSIKNLQHQNFVSVDRELALGKIYKEKKNLQNKCKRGFAEGPNLGEWVGASIRRGYPGLLVTIPKANLRIYDFVR
jgi:hypothetical protein